MDTTMKKQLFIAFLVLCVQIVFAQTESAETWNSRGKQYYNQGNYAKAIECYLEAKNIYEKTLGKEHPYYATSVDNLGFLYYRMGDYAKTERYFLEAIAIYEKALGKEHSYYTTSVDNLRELYYRMGDYAKAERYSLEDKAITEKALGKEHPDYATSLNNLGALYVEMGDYAQAEQYYLEAAAIYEKALGKEHRDYATSLNNLGGLYYRMGDYTKAERYFLEATAIREKALGKVHPDYAVSLNNMGLLYYSKDEYAEAERCYLEATAIWEKAGGKERPDYAASLINLGALYWSMGDYRKAERYYLEAAAIREKVLGKGHPDYAASLINLGALYDSMGDYAKAERCYKGATAIQEKALDKGHPDYAVSLDNLCALYLSKKEYAPAFLYKKEQIKLITDLINKNFSFQTEQQRDAYWNANSYSFELTYSLSFFYPHPSNNILNYDNALFSKGLLLRTTNAVRDAIYASGNQALINQFEELGRLRQQINALRQKEGSNEAYIQSLETQAEALDKSLTRSSAAFREFQSNLAVNWQNVQKSLQRNEAAIEFVSFRIFDRKWTDTVQYAAIVLRPGMNAPAWIPLCEEGKLKEILDRVEGRGYTDLLKTERIYDTFGDELYSLVWEPLEKELRGVSAIYYSPSALLHKISLNALPVKGRNNKQLVDVYNLNLVSSTREVVRLSQNKTRKAQISSAALYGGLDYNASAQAMREAARPYRRDGSADIISGLPEWLIRENGYSLLPTSQGEVLTVQGYLDRKKVFNTLYQGSAGNEESFRALGGKKTGLIYLATHGFFLPDIERKHDEREQMQQSQRANTLKASENPLLRSGLLLAGGNNALTNKPVEGVESGVLTADKIAGINLLGAQLVVLSACQTGLGDVNNKEGVFGLQRSFKLAGVETLIMSLWEVDATSSAKLMSVFLQEWLISGKTKQAAFKEAQRQVRAQHPEPYHWAAFVMLD
jgi:CHAT domain-containing protein/Flp pilus assembly protein TadD